MLNRELAILVFRALAIWIVSTGTAQALDLGLTWAISGRAMDGVLSESGRAAWETPESYLRLAISALIGRVGFGVALWLLAARLARLAFPEAQLRPVDFGTREALYRGATVLVGLWLLGLALPDLGYLAMFVSKGWRPEDAEGYGRITEPTIQFLLGIALLRGHWFIALVREADENAEAEDRASHKETGA